MREMIEMTAEMTTFNEGFRSVLKIMTIMGIKIESIAKATAILS